MRLILVATEFNLNKDTLYSAKLRDNVGTPIPKDKLGHVLKQFNTGDFTVIITLKRKSTGNAVSLTADVSESNFWKVPLLEY